MELVSKTLDMLGKHTTSELNPSPPLLSSGRRFFQSALAGSYLICLLLRSGTQLSPLASWRSAHLLSVLSLMLPLSCVLILHLVSYLMMPRLPLKAFWKLHRLLDWKAFFFGAGHLSVLWVLSRSLNHSDSPILAAHTVLVPYLTAYESGLWWPVFDWQSMSVSHWKYFFLLFHYFSLQSFRILSSQTALYLYVLKIFYTEFHLFYFLGVCFTLSQLHATFLFCHICNF